jgi:translocator protein
MNKYLKLFIAVVFCELAGIAATPITITSINTWYRALNKPSFSPPNWVFGPVWTVLYLLMGISAFLIWEKGLNKKEVRVALIYFLIQLICNFLWSLLFFGFYSPLIALIDIFVLWVAISLTIIKFHSISKPAAYLLIPYLLWVSFAAVLNLSIVVLN